MTYEFFRSAKLGISSGRAFYGTIIEFDTEPSAFVEKFPSENDLSGTGFTSRGEVLSLYEYKGKILAFDLCVLIEFFGNNGI